MKILIMTIISFMFSSCVTYNFKLIIPRDKVLSLGPTVNLTTENEDFGPTYNKEEDVAVGTPDKYENLVCMSEEDKKSLEDKANDKSKPCQTFGIGR